LADDAADQVNSAISSDALQSNIAFIHTTQLRGRVNLRICSINPQTSKSDVQLLIRQLNDIACKQLMRK